MIYVDDPVVRERIPGSGISAPDSRYYGRMNSMREIGGHLFACGDGGQIYGRDPAGLWRCLDDRLLQPPEVPASDRDIFHRIQGPYSDDAYIVGRILHWDGSGIQPITSPTQVMLNDSHIDLDLRLPVTARAAHVPEARGHQGFRRRVGHRFAQDYQSTLDPKVYERRRTSGWTGSSG